jgi:hypothetical protein
MEISPGWKRTPEQLGTGQLELSHDLHDLLFLGDVKGAGSCVVGDVNAKYSRNRAEVLDMELVLQLLLDHVNICWHASDEKVINVDR